MSTQHARLLERARIDNTERVDIRVSSGGYVVMLARRDGTGGAAEARTDADAWLYVGRIREQLDGDLPLVRGPAADKREQI